MDKARVSAWLENWKIVTEVSEQIKTTALRSLTEQEAAEQFNDLDCDSSLLWKQETRVVSSGLVEQQRLFSTAYEHASRFRCRA